MIVTNLQVCLTTKPGFSTLSLWPEAAAVTKADHSAHETGSRQGPCLSGPSTIPASGRLCWGTEFKEVCNKYINNGCRVLGGYSVPGIMVSILCISSRFQLTMMQRGNHYHLHFTRETGAPRFKLHA